MLAPVVERELRVALLRRKARGQWLIAAWTAGGICMLFLLVLNVASARYTGDSLFRWLFALAAASVLFRGFGLTADLFSEERRNGTLGLLVLTGMQPLEIFLNKLMGAVLLVAYGLLGALPFFAIPFLAGGVPADQFFAALVFLANGLLFSVAIGLLASVLHREGGQAQVTAVAITLILSLAAPVAWKIYSELPRGHTPNSDWLALSPATALLMVFGNFTATAPHLFWLSSAFTLIYSLTALLLAAFVLQRTWRDGPETLAPQAWRVRVQKWARGSKFWQARLRDRLLPDQPFCWLAARDRRLVVFAELFLAAAAIVWLIGSSIWPSRWLTEGIALVNSVIIHLGLNWIVAYAASQRLAEDRQSGGFEILLTTPVTPTDIVEGQFRASVIQFRRVFLIALLLDVTFCLTSFTLFASTLFDTVLYLLFWAALIFYWYATHVETASLAMWISAWTGRPGYAAIQAMRTPLLYVFWIGVFFCGMVGVTGTVHTDWILPFLIFITAGLSSFGRRRTLRQKLANELKWIAAAAIPSRGDKRFKSWNPQAIFPPGRWGEFELRASTAPPKPHPRPQRR